MTNLFQTLGACSHGAEDHPIALIVLAPGGKIVRYIYGFAGRHKRAVFFRKGEGGIVRTMQETGGAGHSDYTGSKMGMWFFLFTEMILFGGLFLLYPVYRTLNPDSFHAAAREFDLILGTANRAMSSRCP